MMFSLILTTGPGSGTATVCDMRLTQSQGWQRLRATRHGVLSTIHSDRGVDAVPVVFAVDGTHLFVPVDRVKAKSGARLQRLTNVESDPRCVLLIDHWSDDWAELWWVRAHGTGEVVEGGDTTHWHRLLAQRYDQYESAGTIASGILIEVTALTGWTASSQSFGGK